MDHETGFEPVKNGIFSGEVDFTKPLDLSTIQGKCILITGGASGFGAACARLWAKHGANIMIGDINPTAGQEIVAELRTATGNQNHYFFVCDVSSWKSQAQFFREAAKASPHGGIDVVVANAGISDGVEGQLFETPPDYSLMHDPTEPGITRTLDINLKGVFFTTHLALSYLPRNPGSQPCSHEKHPISRDRQLILISSMAGLAPLPRVASYSAAKHGVVGLFRSLRLTAPLDHGVRVNMVNPYFVKTAILGVGGNLVMAGGGLARIEDVVDTLTRYITDSTIVGRGCAVGPKADEEQTRLVNLPHSGPVWDVYADDFKQSDLFLRRIIGITNLRASMRGWMGLYRDLLALLITPIVGRFMGPKAV